MTTDEALNEADFITEGCGVSERTARATMTLAAEVRRYQAAVEAVRQMVTYDAELGGYKEGGPFVYRADVLAILEPKP